MTRYLVLGWAVLLLVLLVSSVTAEADVLGELPDPTRPYIKPQRSVVMTRAAVAPGVTLLLQSTLVSPERRIAVINGKMLRVGERVGDADVLEIQPHQVIVSRAGARQTLRLLPEAAGLHKIGPVRRNNDSY